MSGQSEHRAACNARSAAVHARSSRFRRPAKPQPSRYTAGSSRFLRWAETRQQRPQPAVLRWCRGDRERDLVTEGQQNRHRHQPWPRGWPRSTGGSTSRQPPTSPSRRPSGSAAGGWTPSTRGRCGCWLRLLTVHGAVELSTEADAAVLRTANGPARRLCESLVDMGLLPSPAPGRYRATAGDSAGYAGGWMVGP